MAFREIKRHRSCFWVGIAENDDSVVINTTYRIQPIFTYKFPELDELSPKGWAPSRNRRNLCNIWIPDNRVDWDIIEDFELWANRANEHIWLEQNKNIEDFFNDNALDLCIAADWNYDFESEQQTAVGEAESQLKYQNQMLSESKSKEYIDILKHSIKDCLEFLPIEKPILVTTIPSVEEDQKKLAWAMARFINRQLGGTFLIGTLRERKPQTKKLSFQQKVEVWKKIYQEEELFLSDSVFNKDILIVDDLYQSGASIWAYAEYLKLLGAQRVFGLVAVKSQRDSDNQ